MRSDTKLAQIRDAMGNGDWTVALKLAAKFQRLGEHAKPIRRAAEASMRPDFYRELGWDLDVIQQDGISALKERFSSSWEKVQSEATDDPPKPDASDRA